MKQHGPLPVPLHLRNAPTQLMKDLGYGAGYQYPHDFEGHFVDAQYLPPELKGERFYHPSPSGYEKTIAERLAWWRGERRESGLAGAAAPPAAESVVPPTASPPASGDEPARRRRKKG